MQTGAITGYMDVAQVALYVFWLFFAGLVFYLRKEDKREGYPLVTERAGQFLQGFPVMPAPKTFLLLNGETVTAPRVDPPEPDFDAQADSIVARRAHASRRQSDAWLPRDPPPLPCAPTCPICCRRRGRTELYRCGSRPTIHVDEESPDPRGNAGIIGADGVVGGIVSDIWIDIAEARRPLCGGDIGGRTLRCWCRCRLVRIDMAGHAVRPVSARLAICRCAHAGQS